MTDPVALIEEHRQRAPLPPDVCYVLDGYLEEDLLDTGSYVALHLLAPRAPILAWADGYEQRPDHQRRVHAFIRREGSPPPSVALAAKYRGAVTCMALADEALMGVPAQLRAGIAAESRAWMRRRIDDTAMVLADFAFTDSTVGGALEDGKSTPCIRRNGDVWPRTWRRLTSRSYINRYVRRYNELDFIRRQSDVLLPRVAQALIERQPLAFIFEDYGKVLSRQRDEARIAAIRAMTSQSIGTSGRKLRKRRRKVIKRSAAVAAAVLSAAEVSEFARGGIIIVPGKSYDLVLSPSLPLTQGVNGHGCLGVGVLEPGTSNVLATLCTYVEDTPALDQVAAFALAMQAGEEADIIERANIIELTDAGRAHPLLAAREARDPRRDGLDDGPPIVVYDPEDPDTMHIDLRHRVIRQGGWRRWTPEEERARNRAYWNLTSETWKACTAVHACGRAGWLLGVEAT